MWEAIERGVKEISHFEEIGLLRETLRLHAPPGRIPSGTTTTVALQVIHSIGDLRAESDGPKRYRTALRDGDEIAFLLDEGPDFIELNSNSGQLTLRPEARHASTHTVTVRVKNGQGGVDVIGFDLVVTAA